MLKKYFYNQTFKPKYAYFIALVLIILFLSQVYNRVYVIPKKKSSVRANPLFSSVGEIREINASYRTSDLWSFRYSYTINGKKYSNKIYLNYKFRTHGSSYLMNRTLPVIYEKDNPKNSWLLIRPTDFEYFNLQFPDSLNWIKEDVIKNEAP